MICPGRTLNYLARLLLQRRRKRGTRWRKLTAGRQALLVLTHPRCGDTYSQLAAGFGVGVSTAYRYIREALAVLGMYAPTLEQAVAAARVKAYVILDATLTPIDHTAADRPVYAANRRRHWMNIQVLVDPFAPAAVGLCRAAGLHP